MGMWDRSMCAAIAALVVAALVGCAKERGSAARLAFVHRPSQQPNTHAKPVVSNSAPAAAASRLAAPADIRVMSFNCRVSTLFDLHNTWGLRKRLLLDTIQNFAPDLLGTQECVAAQYDYLRKQLDGYESVGVGRDDGRRDGEMCAVFYRADKFEKLASGHFWLSSSPSKPGSKGWGAFFPRMVTWVKLRPRDTAGNSSGETFVWFNTHLDAFSSRARLNGAKLLRARMASIAKGLPTLVTGDFNADAGSDPYKTLLAANAATALTDTFRAGHATPMKNDGTRHAFRGGRGGPRIDWILASTDGFRTIDADINHTKSGLMYPSDHFPVTAVLQPTATPTPTLAQVE